jgi:hypothetical protein
MSEDEEIKTWIKFHESLSLFCYTKSRNVINTFNELIDSIVGESKSLFLKSILKSHKKNTYFCFIVIPVMIRH